MTPQEIAAGIAADIRRNGHYQGGNRDAAWSPKNPSGECCVRLNPTTRPAVEAEGREDWDMIQVFEVALVPPAGYVYNRVVRWNDATPTAEVLARLDAIAAGQDVEPVTP